MNKIITYENLRSFAYSNDVICSKPIRGFVVEFMGLNGNAMFSEHSDTAKYYAERGIVFIIPYCNPWAWMNMQTVAFTDEILDVLFGHYALPDTVPVISTGGSMGGLSALVYTRYAKRTPAACVANCPVCDLPYHYTERPDLPRTLYSAFGSYDGELNDVLATASPVHLAAAMPRVTYKIFHCDADQAVNLKRHSAVFCDKMKELGHDIEFIIEPGRGHCDLSPALHELYRRMIVEAVEKSN